MKNQTKRLMIGGFVPAAALLSGLAGCGKSEPTPHESAPAKVVQAETLLIDQRPVAGTYEVTGTVKSELNATLSSKVMGRVVSIAVREGDEIRMGQSLVSIDSRELQSAVNIADANYQASIAGVGSALTAAKMEDKASKARIVQAQAQVAQAQAALASAEARRDLALAGPRSQEIAQAHIAVLQAESNLTVARLELDRTSKLVQDGALARRELDLAQNRFDLAKGQHEAAVQAESIAREGSRSQEIRAAQEAVLLAQAALKQAKSGVVQAQAAAMQVEMRHRDIEVARAQTKQAGAAAQSARVGLSYGQLVAPFSGRVVGRLVDPGSMASPGVPLLSVEGGEYRLEAIVPERFLNTLSVGSTAEVKVDALPASALKGRIVEISPSGDATSHSFVVKFSLGAPKGLKSGMFGKAALKTTASNKVRIPESATWVREGLHYVFAVNAEGIARLRIVTLGDASGGNVTVLSGLGKGDRIVIGDRSEVVDGAKVESK